MLFFLVFCLFNHNLFIYKHLRREVFLPLDTLRTKPLNEQYRQLGGSSKLVIDVIKYNPACIKVVSFFFVSFFPLKKWLGVVPVSLLLTLNICHNLLMPTRYYHFDTFQANALIYTPREDLETRSFLMLAGGTEMEYWREMG